MIKNKQIAVGGLHTAFLFFRVYQNIAGQKGIPDKMLKKPEEAFTQAIKEPSFIKGLKDLRFPVKGDEACKVVRLLDSGLGEEGFGFVGSIRQESIVSM